MNRLKTYLTASLNGSSKGQAINIDWSTGLALFLVTLLSSTVYLINPLALQDHNALENKAVQVQEQLQEEAGRTNHRNTFYVRSPTDIEDVPFDREYYYSTMLGTGVAMPPAELDVPENRFSTVTDTGNTSTDIIYFRGDYEPPSHYSDLDTSSGSVSNSEITIDYSSNVDSTSIGGKQAIRSIQLDGSADEGAENDVFLERFGGNLKVFNSSSEFLVEDDSFVVTTQNYSTLYWHEDETYELTGTGTIREGETEGLTVADSDLGVALMGDMYANVSKPDRSTVRIEADAPRTRIRLHEDGIDYGENRIDTYTARKAFFGTEKVYESLFRSELESIQNMSEREFETGFNLVDWGYNVTVTLEDGNERILSRGDRIAFRDTSISSRQVGFISGEGELKQTDSRVVLWR